MDKKNKAYVGLLGMVKQAEKIRDRGE
jgi:hypothetical protein